jgi:hypothetical protein
MKQYPEIPGSTHAPLGVPCIAFEKYDGSNLRWEWSRKRGWHKFGTRTQLFDRTDPLYGQAIPIFLGTMGDEIARRSNDIERGVQRVICFTEFFGPGSFAGKHVQDEPKELRLIDMNLYKRGLMDPRLFARSFGDLPWCARVVYQGNLNRPLIEDVRKGVYPVWEGVVAKGDGFMVKIKTLAYLARLKEVFGGRAEDFGKYWE